MSSWITPGEAAAALAAGDGAGVRVAVLDSGIEIGHPDFAGRALTEDVVIDLEHPDRFVPGGGQDAYGHGTAIAGIIWAAAPRAEIGSFRVLGPKLSARSALVALAASKAIEQGYHILNCSFACGIPGHLPLYKTWIDEASLAGAHIVAASACHDRERPEWPAHFPTVFGADCARGKLDGLRKFPGRIVEFTAPGEEIRVPWRDGTHRIMTGCSFAAAHLSGVLARMLSAHPVSDPLLAKAAFRRAIEPVDGSG